MLRARCVTVKAIRKMLDQVPAREFAPHSKYPVTFNSSLARARRVVGHHYWRGGEAVTLPIESGLHWSMRPGLTEGVRRAWSGAVEPTCRMGRATHAHQRRPDQEIYSPMTCPLKALGRPPEVKHPISSSLRLAELF